MTLKNINVKQIITIFVISFLTNLIFLLLSRYLINAELLLPLLIGITGLSLIISLITAIGMIYAQDFSKTLMFFNVIAIFNMMYIIIFKTNTWIDLVSMFNYIFFVGLGLMAGSLVQLAKISYQQFDNLKMAGKQAKKVKRIKK